MDSMPHLTDVEQGDMSPADHPPAPASRLQSRAEVLAQEVEERVRRQGLTAGARLGTLESLKAESGFAYATVSEAVRLLRDRGVLQIRPGRGGGLFVADRGPVVRLRHTLLTVAENPETVADAIELRDHLEVLIDVAAARHRTARDVRDLERLLARMRAAHDWEGFMRANWELHERIAAVTPNAMARAVYTSTLGHITAARPNLEDGQAQEYREKRYRVHADLVHAIAEGDAAAVRGAVGRHHATT